eukprot:6914347-Pyramimonas_sp.AAC.1
MEGSTAALQPAAPGARGKRARQGDFLFPDRRGQCVEDNIAERPRLQVLSVQHWECGPKPWMVARDLSVISEQRRHGERRCACGNAANGQVVS